MNLKLNEPEILLKELLMAMPPDLNSAEHLLRKDGYTTENVSKVGNH